MAGETEQLEIWKPVAGFDRYEVSNQGRIRSKGHVFWHDINHCWTFRKGRMLATTRLRNGYVVVTLHDGVRQESHSLHVLVLEAFAGPRPHGNVARHLNGDRLDNRDCNLAWGTPAENSADMVAHGHSIRGEKHHAAKLTWPEVEKIRAEKTAGAKRKHLAEKYGVSRGLIDQICRNAIWKEAA